MGIEAGRVVMDPVAVKALLSGPDGPIARHLEKMGVLAETQAKRLCPVDTGRLRASIRHTLAVEDDEIVCYVGSDVVYAIYQEMGTRFMPAQPFLRPAVDYAIKNGGGL